MNTGILQQLYTVSPWLPLGLFCLGLAGCYTLYVIIKVLVYPNDGKTKVFGDDLEVWPFQTLDIMTNSEARFFQLIMQAVGQKYIVFSQVQLSRIIDAHEDNDSEKWLNRINRMSVDYLLVAQDAQTPLVVIELDDWSHDLKHRKKADAKKDKALRCAGLPVMRYHGEYMPSVASLREDIQQIIDENYEFVEVASE